MTVLKVVAATAALSLVAATTAAAGSTGGTATATPTIADTTLSPWSDYLARAAAASYWGGPITAKTGEMVTIYLSETYPEDPALAQKWADYIASLVHGSEISSVSVYLAPLGEVQGVCGFRALACYSPFRDALYVPGEPPSPEVSAESIVAHEYGHHVAANRVNTPWPAVEYGTKRWASHINVCARTAVGELHPGAERSSEYALNPGEGFAETYRLMNERKAGLAETPWRVVSDALYPDEAAVALAEQDVTTPWQGPTTSTRTGSLSKRTRVRWYTIPTPLDGTLGVTMGVPRSGRFTVALFTPAGARVASETAAGRAVSVTTEICGQRSFRVRVSRVKGAAAFRLTVSTP
jgi:hypothetical protein